MSPMPDRMSDHWWWRPGVRPGRRLLVWHILVDDQQDVHSIVRECQDKLAPLDGLDLIPAEWLHMTTQIIGFGDEIPQTEIDAMIEAAGKRLAELPPITVQLGRLLFHPEVVMLGIDPPRALDPVRAAVRDAVAETVTVHQLDDWPEWTPHLSVAYSHDDGPAAPVIEALAERPSPRPLVVRDVQLVAQLRTGRLYHWERLATVPLGG
ncbi:2'-5' RNA ligase family protein [Thermomonospora cellulosilytica]|uniref:2'-5' RNA ligase n=1 Tax=Thermomonospora cellulosilytica TaxID=1411118 RepID=A0A7W3MU53_9ACTN|nr:2'-5' RNA ligase family protein [Thermomonospora cellulosilytica]MBA9001945.1 2'-5' RNA ligase [Thermomonospora cellulosilytica]